MTRVSASRLVSTPNRYGSSLPLGSDQSSYLGRWTTATSRRPSRERAPEERTPVVQVRAAARSDVSDQVDVRGRPAHEARLEARKLVDEAALAGLREVRVVHGRGTGVLRQAVREELARHPLVEKTASDAEDGATVATLA